MGQLVADLFIALDGYASGEGAPAYFGYPGLELERWVWTTTGRRLRFC